MAADVYLQIDGVNGESNDDKHKGWIEVEAIDWGITQPTAGTVSTAGGHTTGRAVFDAIRITKVVDLASPKLMELAAQGKTTPKAKLEFFRADGSGPLKYYQVTLENVLVSSNRKSYGGSGLVADRFTPRSPRNTPSRK